MKKLFILLAVLLAAPQTVLAQDIKNIDFISPFNEGLSAILKDGKWAFVNHKGDIVVDFRNDLVSSTFNEKDYPIFNSGRCLIIEKRKGISYFGYIDKTGRTVIQPQYLNATNFENGLAIVLELHKTIIGQNDVLDKRMISYSYTEIAIDPNGKTVHYLSDKPTHVTLSKDFLQGPPEIKSSLISDHVISVKNQDGTWSMKKMEL